MEDKVRLWTEQIIGACLTGTKSMAETRLLVSAIVEKIHSDGYRECLEEEAHAIEQMRRRGY